MREANERTGRQSILFASYNVHKCVGVDRKFDPDRVQRVIAEIGADVIALQEADRRFGEKAGLLDLDAIAAQTGLEAVPLARHRHRLGHGWHGNVLMVRSGRRVRDVRQIDLPGLEPRGAVVADLELADGTVRVIAAHLGLLRHSRLAQVRTILAALPHEEELPTVLLGDLNEWRRRDRRSALGSLPPGFGPIGDFVPSFPSVFPVLALDRIFARPHGIIEEVVAHASPLARVASDHLPVKARVRIPPWAAAAPAAPASRDAAHHPAHADARAEVRAEARADGRAGGRAEARARSGAPANAGAAPANAGAAPGEPAGSPAGPVADSPAEPAAETPPRRRRAFRIGRRLS